MGSGLCVEMRWPDHYQERFLCPPPFSVCLPFPLEAGAGAVDAI